MQRRPLVPALALLLALPAGAQAPRVTSVSPLPETVGAARDGALVVQFDEALDPATVTAASFRVLGRWTGPVAGTLTLEDDDRRIRFVPAAPLAVGDLVLVQLARTISDAGGAPMAHGYAWQFWTAAGPSTLDYSEDYRLALRREGEGPIVVYGAHGGDLDGDGASDLVTSQEISGDARVLLNDGSGGYDAFTVHPLPDADFPSPLEGADFDHDGDLDLAIGNTRNDKVSILLGDGQGGFASVVSYPTAGSSTRSVALGDFDGDGHDDVVTASRTGGVLSFLRGRGDGTLDPPQTFDGSGTSETALATTDANGDGLLDLFVGDNAGGVSVCLGDGDGGFACGPEAGLPNGGPWMIAAGDLDGDGHVGVAVASSSVNGVEVLYGDGAGGFADTSFLPAGTFPIAIDLGDLDGDGDLDVISSNFVGNDYTLYENDGGTLVFSRSLPAVQAGSCMTLHDRDGDGRLDLTGIDERADLALLFASPPPPVATEPGAEGGDLALVATENPFRGQTALRVRAPAAEALRLVVLDALGREVAVLLDEAVSAGERTVTWDARGLPAGRYLARLVGGGETVTASLTLLR